MRRRFAIPIILTAAVLPWYWFKPPSPKAEQPARLSAVFDLEHDADWFGGLSGIEVSGDGATFYAVTDRGRIVRGDLLRQSDVLTQATITNEQAIVDRFGNERDFPHTDAEGIAISPDDSVFISFEHAHRILRYDTWSSAAKWPSYTKSWRALSKNKGLEALAVDGSGTLYSLPEDIAPGATEALVYRRMPGRKWEQPFTIPVDPQYAPVGADFGPDGRLYLLERGLYYPVGFFSRIRSMEVSEDGVDDIQTVLETPLGRHGNLEGLSVWQDANGSIRLTMVSDDNFLPIMRSQIVEYIVEHRVAIGAE